MIRIFFLAAAIAVLNACASHPKPAVTDESHELWQQRQQQFAAINRWDIRGRVALYINDEVHNLGLSWSRKSTHSILKLEAPLSQGMVKLETTDTGVTLTTVEGDSYSGDNAEEKLRHVTGWSIPVQGLTSWIKGINHNSSDYSPDIDASGRALSILQDDWRINYLNYGETQLAAYNYPELPQKIYMKHANLALKIIIDQWQNPDIVPDTNLFPSFPR